MTDETNCMRCGKYAGFADAVCDACMSEMDKKWNAFGNATIVSGSISQPEPLAADTIAKLEKLSVYYEPKPAVESVNEDIKDVAASGPFYFGTFAGEPMAVSAKITKCTKKKAKREVEIEPLATLTQEHPYKVYKIRKRTNQKEFLTWLNTIKDTTFAIVVGNETIKFKGPRDVSNFMLGYNVCIDMMNDRF